MTPLVRARRLGDVPHEGDLWVSTDDALDYARWLDRRVRELDAAAKAQIASPAIQDWMRATWLPWWISWNAFRGGLEANWADRVAAWDAIKQRHAELVEHRSKAVAAGLRNAPALDATPKDPEQKIADGVTGVAGGLSTGLIVAGVGLLALVLVLKK